MNGRLDEVVDGDEHLDSVVRQLREVRVHVERDPEEQHLLHREQHNGRKRLDRLAVLHQLSAGDVLAVHLNHLKEKIEDGPHRGEPLARLDIDQVARLFEEISFGEDEAYA